MGEREVRQSTATAEAAAVRSAVSQVASRTASVRPVAASMSTMVACIVGQAASGVAGNLGDQLGREHAAHERGLEEEHALVRRDLHHAAQRLHHAARGKIDQRLAHAGDERLQAEQAANLGVGDVQSHG